MSLLTELKRRNVIRFGVVWLALSWLLVAIANLLFPAMNIPISSVRWLLIGLLLGLPVVLLLAWRHQWQPHRSKADRGLASDLKPLDVSAMLRSIRADPAIQANLQFWIGQKLFAAHAYPVGLGYAASATTTINTELGSTS